MEEISYKRGFHIRFSETDPRDVALLELMRADTGSQKVNISATIKELLFAWYLKRQEGHSIGTSLMLVSGSHPGALRLPGGEIEARPEDPLAQAMLGLEFDEI